MMEGIETPTDILSTTVWADYECDPRHFQKLLHDATSTKTNDDKLKVPESFTCTKVNNFYFCMYKTNTNGKLNQGVYMPFEIAKNLLK